MIRRYLVYGKQLFLTSRRLEEAEGVKAPIVELLLPLKLFWELEETLKRIDYMIVTNEDPVVVNDWQRKVLQKIVSYTTTEKDRATINELLKKEST